MNLTRESEYALKGLAWLAKYPVGTTVPMAEIAAEQQLPTTFLAKIFLKLARHSLLDADRGRGSGYRLRGEPSGIRVRDVLEAVEGPTALKRCLLVDRPLQRDGTVPAASPAQAVPFAARSNVERGNTGRIRGGVSQRQPLGLGVSRS